MHSQLLIRFDRVARKKIDYLSEATTDKDRHVWLSFDIQLAIDRFLWIPLLRCRLHDIYPMRVVTAASKTNRIAIPYPEYFQVFISFAVRFFCSINLFFLFICTSVI